MRLNRIIDNTEKISDKLDMVMSNQKELAYALVDANDSVKNLTSNIESFRDEIRRGMNVMIENQAVNNYEMQRQNNSLDYMSFMNTLYVYK